MINAGETDRRPKQKADCPAKKRRRDMNKQEAIRVLQRHMETLPLEPSLSKSVILFEQRNGAPFISWKSPEDMQAVELVIKNEDYVGYTLQPDEERGWIYALDGDVELIAISRSGDLTILDFEGLKKVGVRRRQAQSREVKDMIPMALRIHKSHRNILPAIARIVDDEDPYVIVTDHKFFITMVKNRVLRGVGYPTSSLSKEEREELLSKTLELQKFFVDNWVKDTFLVWWVPEERAARVSRSEKTHYFHKVTADEVIAGYANQVMAIEGKLGNNEGSVAEITFTRWNANSDGLQQRITLRSDEEFRAFCDFVQEHNSLPKLVNGTQNIV